MRYDFGDVILVPFPFTDQSTAKQRPAVVISSSRYNTERPDLILLAVTSQIRLSLAFGEALLTDWETAGLIKPSIFKSIITTIEQTLVIKRLGKISPHDETVLRTVIEKIVG